MKVVRVINSLGYGGIERVYEIVAKYYVGPKSDLIFVALGDGGPTATIISNLGYEVIVLGMQSRIPNFQLVIRLTRLLGKLKPDVVHSCGAEGNFHGQIAAWLARVPVRIAEEIGMPSQGKLARRIFGMVYRFSSAVIAVAATVAAFLEQSNGVDKKKLTIIYNPVDSERFTGIIRQETKQFVFLSVCRLHPIKNLRSLLRAFASLSNRGNLALWIVGDGEERGPLEALALELGITSQISFMGYHSDPSPYFAKASAFVLPSFSEGHPVSMIEAMTARIPVVVTRVGGASELVIDGDNGFLLDPNDLQNITAKLSAVSSMPEEARRAMAAKAAEMVSQRFTPSSYFESINSLYSRLLNGRH